MGERNKNAFSNQERNVGPSRILWIVLLCFFLSIVSAASAAVKLETSMTVEGVHKNTGNIKVDMLRMPFITNQGQIKNKQVQFYTQTFGGTIYITAKGEIVYAFPIAEFKADPKKRSSKAPNIKRLALKECLIDASMTKPQGLEKAQTRVNYLIGQDKSQWKTNIPTYNSVELVSIRRHN